MLELQKLLRSDTLDRFTLAKLGELATLWKADEIHAIAEAIHDNGLVIRELVTAIGLDLDDLVALQAVKRDRDQAGAVLLNELLHAGFPSDTG